MPANIPLSKLHSPRAGPDRVDRPRLLNLLDQSLVGQFTLVAAPAGYGKTTLLSQWARHQSLPVAWLALDEGDNDPVMFLEGLLAAVRSVFPKCCPGMDDLLVRPTLPAVELLSRELAYELEDVDDFILILDDSHVLNDPSALEFLRRMIYQPPVSLRLVLSGRADPPLALGALRGKGRLHEVRAAQLRFTDEEAIRYLQQALGRPMDDELVSLLVERTEGWIAGLHLAALSLAQRTDVSEGIRELAGTDRYIADYLMEELLNRLDPELQIFLIRTSILERLSSSLCAAVAGQGAIASVDGRPVLEWLEETNLFVVSLDDQRQWFRYHHLFRDLLRHRLQTVSDDQEVNDLHVRAGEWLGRAQRVEEALVHLLKAGRPDMAADLAEERRFEVIDHEDWVDLERWVGSLGPELVDSRSGLVIIHGWLAQQRGDVPDMNRHCDRAEALLAAEEGLRPTGDILRGELAGMRAMASFWSGDEVKSLAQARESLTLLPPTCRVARATATVIEGGALHVLGHNEGALKVLSEGAFGEYGVGIHPRAMVGLATLAVVRGELDYAHHVAGVMLSQANEQGLMDSAGWAHYFLALAAYLRDDLYGAEEHSRVIQVHTSHITPGKQSYYVRAWIRYAQGRFDEALAIMDDCLAVASDLDLPIRPEVRLLRARMAMLCGHPMDDVLLARSELPGPGGGRLNLKLCHELSTLSALHILVVEGTEEDLDACSKTLGTLLATAEAQGNVFRHIQGLLLQALLLDRRSQNAEALSALAQAIALAKPGRLVRIFPEMGDRLYTLLQALRVRRHQDPFVDLLLASFSGSRQAIHGVSSYSVPVFGPDPLIDSLVTNREAEVLELLEQRLSNKEIARRLVISPATVKRHTLSLYRKLGVEGRREAVAKARRLGLLGSAHGET